MPTCLDATDAHGVHGPAHGLRGQGEAEGGRFGRQCSQRWSAHTAGCRLKINQPRFTLLDMPRGAEPPGTCLQVAGSRVLEPGALQAGAHRGLREEEWERQWAGSEVSRPRCGTGAGMLTSTGLCQACASSAEVAGKGSSWAGSGVSGRRQAVSGRRRRRRQQASRPEAHIGRLVGHVVVQQGRAGHPGEAQGAGATGSDCRRRGQGTVQAGGTHAAAAATGREQESERKQVQRLPGFQLLVGGGRPAGASCACLVTLWRQVTIN